MMFPQQGFSAAERRLVKLYRSLAASDREALLAFGQFLAHRGSGTPRAAEPSEPGPLDRPSQESVVAAIKRLRRAYHMLEQGDLLHETSFLMSAHVLQGRPAAEVIDELEVLFARHYAAYRDGRPSPQRG
jgi:hypothetical protein